MTMALAKAAEGTARNRPKKERGGTPGRCPYRQRLMRDSAKQGDRNQAVCPLRSKPERGDHSGTAKKRITGYAWTFLASTLRAAQRGANRLPLCIAPLRVMFCMPVIWQSGPISRHLNWRCNGPGPGSLALISRLGKRGGSLKRSAGRVVGRTMFAMQGLSRGADSVKSLMPIGGRGEVVIRNIAGKRILQPDQSVRRRFMVCRSASCSSKELPVFWHQM